MLDDYILQNRCQYSRKQANSLASFWYKMAAFCQYSEREDRARLWVRGLRGPVLPATEAPQKQAHTLTHSLLHKRRNIVGAAENGTVDVSRGTRHWEMKWVTWYRKEETLQDYPLNLSRLRRYRWGRRQLAGLGVLVPNDFPDLRFGLFSFVVRGPSLPLAFFLVFELFEWIADFDNVLFR